MCKVNERRTPSDGKSSQCIWQGELKRCSTYCYQFYFANRGMAETLVLPSRGIPDELHTWIKLNLIEMSLNRASNNNLGLNTCVQSNLPMRSPLFSSHLY